MKKRVFIIFIILTLLLAGCKNKDKDIVESTNGVEEPSNGSESPKDDNEKETEKKANMEIEIKVQNQKPIYIENGNILKDNTILKEGYIIKFIYENLDGFIVGEGFRTLKETENLFVVEKANELSISVDIKGNWHKFNFILEGSQSSIESGVFNSDDLVLKLGNNYFNIEDKPTDLVALLPGGKSTNHDIETIDPDVKLFEYNKDGIKIFYYDNPEDDGFNAFTDMISVESANYPTNKGLRVGDTYEKMIELYGEYNDTSQYENNVFYYYTTDEINEYRMFSLSFDKATKRLERYSVFGSL